MEQIDTSFTNLVTGTQPEVLHTIHLQEKNIAIYQRDTSHLQNDLQTCMQEKITFNQSGTIQEIQTALENKFPTCQELIADIVNLLEIFGQISDSSKFKIALLTVNNNMCRKFHTDVNELRLLCSYAGQGTVWLPEEAINRNGLNGRGNNQTIVKDETLIQKVQTGDVAILKGAVYPKDGTNAVVHRSPTIEETGENRLLLRVDTDKFLSFLE